MTQKGPSRVQCYLRFRPLETKQTSSTVIKFTNKTVSANRHMHYESTMYSFDEVFEPSTKNPEIFAHIVTPILQKNTEKNSACFFAYGQTNSGKSFTIDGMLLLAFEKLIGNFSNLEISATQIYNARVTRLLARPVRVQSAADLEICLQEISDSRATHETNMNAVSSRSHVIYEISDSDRLRLVFVDLAGSEKVGKTGVTGNRLEEAKAINKSLHALGNCVRALTKISDKNVVPFRDSKLTVLLKDVLISEMPLVFICCASFAAENDEETISTLRFAQTAKRMRAIFSEISDSGDSEVTALRALVAELEACRVLQAEKIHWLAGQHRKFLRSCLRWDQTGRTDLPPWARDSNADSASET